MCRDVEDFIQLERDVVDRANALASLARRVLITQPERAMDVEIAARALTQARGILGNALRDVQEVQACAA